MKGTTIMGKKTQSLSDRWAFFRFSVVGSLLARPPAKGELCKELRTLANKAYKHPVSNCMTKFHYSTIECWYYKAKNSQDPVAALARKLRSDNGKHIRTDPEIIKILGEQYKHYPHWSYQLHSDNLEAVIEHRREIQIVPSYATVRRRMMERGWVKKASFKKNQTPGQKKAALNFENREQRSYEAEYVHQLWHLDFHHSSLRIVDSNGQWHTPKALCILDDHSRLCCHIQWYLNETAEVLIHGLSQAFFKRGLPRALMTDNGAAMVAHETCNGLKRLGIKHKTTLPYSPYQNGKQESFWGNLEGRLMAMLHHIEFLSLKYLNNATQAWAEMEYNKKKHFEIGTSPLKCMLESKDISRNAHDEQSMELGFTLLESRKLRRSDCTISINGVRFEVPWQYSHIPQLHVRFTNWNKAKAFIVDKRTGKLLSVIYPLDKTKNSSGKRRIKSVPEEIKLPDTALKDTEPALLKKLMAQYAKTGMPAAYIPKGES
jgi:transposase InsO family protein